MGLRLGRREALGSVGALGLVGALAACAGDGLAAGEIDAAAAGELARRPENYVNGEARAFAVSRDGRAAGLLWGTVHIGYDGATVMPRAVRERFAVAPSLSVEVVLDRVPGPTWRAMAAAVREPLLRVEPGAVGRLDPATRRELDAAGLPSGSLERFSLAGLAQLVNRQALAAPSGALPALGIVDSSLIGFARSLSIPVRGLEEVDAGMMRRAVIAEPNGEAAAASLRLALRQRHYAAGEVGVMLAGLVAWKADAVDLARHDRGRPVTLTERNAAWMPRLEATLGEPGVAFVAFGAGHLMGTDGVVALLRARGWDVSACVGDRCRA